MKKNTLNKNADASKQKAPAGKEQNKKPVSKKLSATHESDTAGEQKRAHHRGSSEQAKTLKDSSSRGTRESESYRSGTTKD